MIRKSSISLAVVLILLGMNLALITTSSVIPTSELNLHNDEDVLLEDTWDFGVGGRYQPSSAHIDSNEKVVVILAETSDLRMGYSNSYFEEMLFGQEFGEMGHYFTETTYGFTEITGVVVGPVRLPKSLTYYDPGDEENIREGIEVAISLADASINFSPYDQDGDGLVDNFMIIFAGEDDASNGGGQDPGAVWPHKWQLSSTYHTNDGVGFSKYFTCAEECGMGTFAHEISHNFGLPDLYDSYDYSSEGIGEWGLMGSGNHLRTSSGTPNPAHFNAWSKQELGLLDPTEVDISASQTYTLRAASSHADALKIPITSSEYFLIEFRSTTANDYDAAIHSSGILIWHIDEDVCASVHSVNGDESHPCVRLIQADGDNDLENSRNRGDYGDSWKSGRSFNPNSIPPSRSYSGSYVDVQMTITAAYSSYATIHFGSYTAWFYDITAEVQDDNNDGFNNEILFTYDPDTDGSSQDIMIQFDFYQADKTGTPYSFYDNRTIQGSEFDTFEYEIGYYNGFANGLWWIEVRLWVGSDMTDLKIFGNIWIEYPSSSNNNDEWLDSVDWLTLDTTGDGFNDSLVVDFETVSAQSWGGTGDVYLELYSDENVSYEARHSEYRTSLDWGSHSITIDMSETDLEPGILRGNLVLYVDSQREHIASILNLDLWWDSVRLQNPMGIAHDLDEDGAFDSIEVSFDIDHSFRIETPVLFEVNAWNMSEFTGFTSMQESLSILLGPMSESNPGGRGEQSFWLYAEWQQEVIIEIRAVLPNGNEFTETIFWDEYNDEYGFSLQPLDWPVTAWQTNIQLLDSNSDGQQDLFRAQYDLDSVSDALDVAVELLVITPDNDHYSIWDNYTINGDLYDLRNLDFPTWISGEHEFILRVHDLSDNEIEYEENFGQVTLSSAFANPSLSLEPSGNLEGDLAQGFVATRGSECHIHAILSDPIGDFYDSMGEIKWSYDWAPENSAPFIPNVDSDTLDCSQWGAGDYSISANYENVLGIFVDAIFVIEVVNPPGPPDIVLDLSGIPETGTDSCVIGINNVVDSIDNPPATVVRYEWYIDGELSTTSTATHSCSEFDFGITYVEVYAFGEGDLFDVEKANIVLAMDSTSSDSNSNLEISPEDNVETESWGVITTIILCIIALLVPIIIFRKRSSSAEYDSDPGDAIWMDQSQDPRPSTMGFNQDNILDAPHNPSPQSAPPISPPPLSTQPTSPPPQSAPPTSPPPQSAPPTSPPPQSAPPATPPSWEEDGFTWRKWGDGTLEYFDETTQDWLEFNIG